MAEYFAFFLGHGLGWHGFRDWIHPRGNGWTIWSVIATALRWEPCPAPPDDHWRTVHASWGLAQIVVSLILPRSASRVG